MDFIQHTIEWCRGEIFEGRLILLFGIVTIIIAFLFWKAGTTPGARAMLWPLLIVGLLYSMTGAGMMYNNNQRIINYTKAYENNPVQFLESEKERTDTFISWYPKTRYIFAGIAILGILFNIFWAAPLGRAIGLCLILMTLATYVVDHFSEERADKYHIEIMKELQNQ